MGQALGLVGILDLQLRMRTILVIFDNLSAYRLCKALSNRRLTRSHRHDGTCRRGFEVLEQRVVLAAAGEPLAIGGTVYDDINADGQPSAGEGIPNVTVELFSDDGNGLLDAADSRVETQSTDANGGYCFDGLDANSRYFVVRPEQEVSGQNLERFVSRPLSVGASSIVIDEFFTRQIVTATPLDSNVASTQVLDSLEVIGEERDIHVELVSGNTELDLRVNPFGVDDVLVFDAAAGAIGNRIVTWDGIDGDGAHLSLGLNGLDLTDGGKNTGIALRAGRDQQETRLQFRIYQGNTETFSSASVEIPITGGRPDAFVYVPFSEFTGPVTPANVDAIQMIIDATDQSGDGTIDVIGLTGPRTVNIATVQRADLIITKDNSVETVEPGQAVTYIVTARNAGPDDVVGATIFDTFPSSLEDVTFTSRVTGEASGNTPSGGVFISDQVDMAVGSIITYTIQATVSSNATGEVSNTARIIPPATITDPDIENNASTDADVVGRPIDLRTFKDDGVRHIEPGQDLTYTIHFINMGPGPIEGALAEDMFSPDLLNVSWTSFGSSGTSGNTPQGTGNIRDLLNLPEGGRVTYTVNATVSENVGRTLVNLARITPPVGYIDTRPEDNVETDIDLVDRFNADISITKSDGQTTAVPGSEVTYEIVVANNGPANAARIQVFDDAETVLQNVTYTSEVISGDVSGNTNGTEDIDDLLTMSAGSSVRYLLTGTVPSDATGELTNIASVMSTTDANPENDIAADTDILTPQADLVISKDDGIETVNPGDALTYTVVVTNNGPSDVVGATVNDFFSDDLTNIRYTSTAVGGASGNTAAGSGDIDDSINLPAGASVTYTVNATVTAGAVGQIANTASVTAPAGVTELNNANNIDTDVDSIGRQAVDVAITKVPSSLEAIPGHSMSYEIVVANIGNSEVVGATVQDVMPPEMADVTWQSTATAGASGNAPQGAGSINDVVNLLPGSSITYTMTGTIVSHATGSITNTARASAVEDTRLDNNVATAVVDLDPHADLSITKTDGVVFVEIGQATTYTVTVKNDGPSDVVGATVQDILPDAFLNPTYTSSTTGTVSGNTVNGQGDIIDTINIAAGSTLTYLISGTVGFDVSGTLTNMVTVTAPDSVVEINPTNNFASDTNTNESVIVLGSPPDIRWRDAIVSGDDADVFQITAHHTGKMLITAHFRHSFGNLDLRVSDSNGNTIVESNSMTDNEMVSIPVVTQETYFIRIAPNGEATNIYDLEIENFPAPVPVVPRIAANSDSGMMNNDGVTNNSNPRFLINADLADFNAMGIQTLQPEDPETNSTSVPAGPGAAVEITLTNTTTGASVTGFASPVGDNSTLFHFVPINPLPDGHYLATAAVRIYDGRSTSNGPNPATGRTLASEPYPFTIDQVGPTSTGRPDLFRISDSGMSDVDNVTNKMQPAFGGTGEPNSKVRLFVNRQGEGVAEIVGQSVVTSGGQWEITVEPLVDGVHHIRAQFEDLAGNISGLGEPLVIEVDTTEPNTPHLDLIAESDTGMSRTDNVTNENQLTFTMTTQDPGQDAHMLDFNYKYRLFLRPDSSTNGIAGEEILVYDSVADQQIPLEQLLDGLTNNEVLTRTIGILPDGVHNFKLEVEDRAGNISHDFLLNVTIDTQSPAATIDMIESSDAGMLNDDNVTNKMQPAFSGVSEVGSKVAILANGNLIGQGTVMTDASDGDPTNGQGVWEVTVEPLADGNYEITSQITDLAGNTNTSPPLSIWVDTQKPNIPLLDLITDTGISDTDNITSDTTPTVTVTAGATTDGGRNEFPNDIKYRIYDRPGDGTGEVLLIDSFGALRDFTNEGFFTETLPELAEGVHNLKLEIEDRAGNISDAFLLEIKIDGSTPIVTANLLTASDSGMLNDDNVTRIAAPTIVGTGTVGDTVYVYADGTLVGQGNVGSDRTDGNMEDGLGAWQVTIDPLRDGAYEITAQIEDSAGNFVESDPLNITIDTVPPNQPLIDLTTDTGISETDNITNVNTPGITITVNDTVDGGANPNPHDVKYRIYDRPGDGNGEVLLVDSFAVDGDFTTGGQFAITLPELADGVHNLKLEVEDRAGNVSNAFLLNVEIDTVPPMGGTILLLPSSDSGMMQDDGVTNKMQPAFTGVSSVGSMVVVIANDQVVGEGIVGSDESDLTPENDLGVWEITVEPLIDGDYEVTALLEDLAGNTVTIQPTTMTIDTVEPNTPLLDLITDTGVSTTDNITNDNTPLVTVTANDTIDGGENPFPNDIKYRIYDRDGMGNELLLVDSFAVFGGFSTGGVFEETLPELADGVHNLKLEIEDRAGNISHDFLLEIIIDTTAPEMVDVDLLDASDTGMSNTDNVTSMQSPAFKGTGTVGDTVYLFANGELVGETVVGSDETDGIPDNLRGAWEITSEPLDDDVYEIVAHVEDDAGNFALSDPLTIEVDTIAPNTPFLDLREADDTGRHNDDNITNAETLIFSATSHDANDDLHRQLVPDGQNFKYRIYARPEFGDEVLVYNSVTDANLADLLDGLTAETQVLTTPIELPEGLHNLKLEVEDRAGNISTDFLFDLLIDRTPAICDGALHPDSDSGIPGIPETFTDGVTNVATPSFAGTAEANSVVSITIDGVPAGTAVAIPLDGDDAFQPPNEPNVVAGNWRIDTVVALADGVHTVEITCEDPAGNRQVETLEVIIIDTQGPRIENVTRVDQASLFEPKPSSGPDPLIASIIVHFIDLPNRTNGPAAAAIVESIASEEGNYTLVGDANGNIPIVNVQVTNDIGVDGFARSQVELFFAESLPDDRFTLTVSETISDVAGNALDGESGAVAPFEGNPGLQPTDPIFPTGDGVPGGDFIARFTVDSRPELGTWSASNIWIDINGNFRFDPDNFDFVNRDIVYKLGFTSDDVFAGNFSLRPNSTTDGYDKLAVYGRHDGQMRWLVDTDNDGVTNIDRTDPHQVNGLPFAGRFDDNDANGDEVGVFNGRTWYFDTDHDFRTDMSLPSALIGYPFVGDFDGDGFDDLGTYADDTFMLDLANGVRRGWDGKIDQRINFHFIGVRERPVSADMDQDGFDDIGLWVPDREGVTDRDRSEWYFLISDGRSLLRRISPQGRSRQHRSDDRFHSRAVRT